METTLAKIKEIKSEVKILKEKKEKKLKNKLTKKGITKKKRSEEKGKVKEVLNKAEINFLDCLMKFKGNSFKNFTINFLYEKLK